MTPIILLEKGEIKSQGSFEDLININDNFKLSAKKLEDEKIFYENIYERIPTSQKIINFKNSEKGACYIFGDGKNRLNIITFPVFQIYHLYR